jgi:hypothetical protein
MESAKSSRLPGLVLLLATIILVVILWVIFGWGAIWYFKRKYEVAGTFGDTFGAVNALFSGLAFAGLLYAIYLQRHDLNLQYQAIMQSLEESRRSAKAQEESVKALAEQAWNQLMAARLAAAASLSGGYNDGMNVEGNPSVIVLLKLQRDHYRQLQELLLCEVRCRQDQRLASRTPESVFLEQLHDRHHLQWQSFASNPEAIKYGPNELWQSLANELKIFAHQDTVRETNLCMRVNDVVREIEGTHWGKMLRPDDESPQDWIERLKKQFDPILGGVRNLI